MDSKPRFRFLAAHSPNSEFPTDKVGLLTTRIANTFGTRELTLVTNSEVNYDQLAAFEPTNYDFQGTLGASTLEYFEGFASTLKELGFQSDGLLKEGFKEAVLRGVVLKVVEHLIKGNCNKKRNTR